MICDICMKNITENIWKIKNTQIKGHKDCVEKHLKWLKENSMNENVNTEHYDIVKLEILQD